MSTSNNFIYNSGKQLDFSYNVLNLPRVVDNGANGKMQFLYSSAGQKLRTTLFDSLANITDTTDYVSNFIYKNGQLSYILMPEGRILPNGSSFDYEYHIADHLGNTRVTYIVAGSGLSSEAEINQTTAYYPFGLPINALSSNLENNPYLYNGKEQHNELDMDLLDYGARYYDAEVARWWSVDPMAEKHYSMSPYNYVAGNPLRFIDPDGRDIDPAYLTDKNHQVAFHQLMSTKEGYALFARYMNKGDKITVGDKTYTFDATGDRAKDILILRSQDKMGALGTARAFLKDKNRQVSGSTTNDNVIQGVREVIDLKTGRTIDQSLTTFAHEIFVHADIDADKLNEIDASIKKGISGEEYISKISNIGNRIYKDHSDLANDKVTKFKSVMKKLGKLDLYYKNVKKHERYKKYKGN